MNKFLGTLRPGLSYDGDGVQSSCAPRSRGKRLRLIPVQRLALSPVEQPVRWPQVG